MISHQQIHKSNKPNVLFIITDQQRYDAVGYVDNNIITPHLNYLSSKSVVCSNTFVQSPQCQPSRASIFTGRYPTAHKVWWNEIKLPKSELTIANILSNDGYTTGCFGKLHFDGDSSHTDIANHFGFNETFLFEDWQQAISVKSKSTNRIAEEFYGPMSKPTWTGSLSSPELHHEEIITDKAINFIKSTNSPWFVVVGFHGPHPPYASPVEYRKMYNDLNVQTPNVPSYSNSGYKLTSDDWVELKKQYYGSVSWIDSCVGRLLATVDDETIVVFTSDHGDILGDHGLFSKGMFAYDGNIKVPLVIKIPHFRPMVYDHFVQSIDIAPTLLDLCGSKRYAGMQGHNLTPFFASNRLANNYAISMIGHNPRLRMIRNRAYKYWICDNDEFLFNEANGDNENTNLASYKSDAINYMRLELLKALIKAEDSLPFPS